MLEEDGTPEIAVRRWELLMAKLQILQNHGTKLQQLRRSEEERRSRRTRRYLYNQPKSSSKHETLQLL
jgi:hypothetical protein